MVPTNFIQENAEELARLRALLDRLTDSDLKRDAGGGWTVSALLAHLAFWDYRALVLVNRWKNTGIGPSPIDVDGVNDALVPLFVAIAPREAWRLALSAAEAIDAALAAAPAELIAAIESLGGKFRLRRAQHRREHVDQIEQLLQQSG